jgi:hypothetical protein
LTTLGDDLALYSEIGLTKMAYYPEFRSDDDKRLDLLEVCNEFLDRAEDIGPDGARFLQHKLRAHAMERLDEKLKGIEVVYRAD